MDRLNKKDFNDEIIIQELFRALPNPKWEKHIPIFIDWIEGVSIQKLHEKYEMSTNNVSRVIHRFCAWYIMVVNHITNPIIPKEYRARECILKYTHSARNSDLIPRIMEIRDIRELQNYTKEEFFNKWNSRFSRKGIDNPEEFFKMMEDMDIHFKEA